MGKLRNSLRSNNEAFFIHFLSCTIGSVRSGWRSKSTTTSKATATSKQSVPTALSFPIAVVGRCFWLCFWPTPVWDDVICAWQKMGSGLRMFERSEFSQHPIFWHAQIMLKRSVSTRRASLRSPFLDYLFWRSKKGNWLSGHTRPVNVEQARTLSRHK